MGISGDIADISLVDVFRIVRSKSGVLTVKPSPDFMEYSIGLHKNHVVSLETGSRTVDSREDASEELRQLLKKNSGPFTFRESDETPRAFILPLYPIVQAVTQVQAIPEAELPHPDTRFQLVATHTEVPAALRASWNDLAPLLRIGTTAGEAANLLGLSVRDAQTLLYRYRAAELIVLSPARAEVAIGAADDRYRSPDTQSMLRRFIHRLRSWGAA